MVSGGSTPIGSRPMSTYDGPLVFKPSAAALRKAIEKVEVSKPGEGVAREDRHGLGVDDSVVRPRHPACDTSMECEASPAPSEEPLSSRRSNREVRASATTEPMDSGEEEEEEADYEELFYSVAEDDAPPSAEEPVYAVPKKKKLRDKLINVIGSVGGGGGGASGVGSQERAPLPTPRNGRGRICSSEVLLATFN